MDYVYELVAESDIQPYGLDKKIPGVLYSAGAGRRWAVDRAARSYLRCIGHDRETDQNYAYWDFLWEGFLISLVIAQEHAGIDNGCYLNHRRIVRLDLPAEHENRRREVQSSISEAFAVTVLGNLPPEAQSSVIKVDFPNGESYVY